jgi:CspA family cold shock protein
MFSVTRLSLLPRQVGTVKWFDVKKGFGFITPKDSVNDIFVHQSNIISATGFRSLKDGLEVSYTLSPDKTGKNQAYEVRLVDGSPVSFTN